MTLAVSAALPLAPPQPEFDVYELQVPPWRSAQPSEIELMNDRVFGMAHDDRPVTLLQPTRVPRTGLTFITGYSGAGKSTLLRLIQERFPDAVTLPSIEPDAVPLELFTDLGFSAAVSFLSGFGLAEPRLLKNPFRNLSDGQKFRLRMALLMKDRPAVVVVDEFLSTLDRTTARVISHRFQALCRKTNTTAFLAAAQDDLVECLAPDHLIRIDLDGSSTTTAYRCEHGPHLEERGRLEVADGTLEDYDVLARYHYAEHEDDEVTDWRDRLRQIRVVRYEGKTIAVAVTLYPYPSFLNQIPLFHALNERLFYYYRTVIHPAFRGLGLTDLVQPVAGEGVVAAYGYTALGLYFGFLHKAGYENYEHPRSQRLPEHDELEEVLRAAGAPPISELYRISVAQKLWDDLDEATRVRVRELARRIVTHVEAESCLQLIEFAELAPTTDEGGAARVACFFRALIGKTPGEQMGVLLSAAIHIRVQGVVKRFDHGQKRGGSDE